MVDVVRFLVFRTIQTVVQYGSAGRSPFEAVLADSDGERRLKMPLYPDPAPPVERTGAGDAYASTLLAALLHGLSIEEAVRWAPINSMSVVQHTGAQAGLLTPEELMKYLREAPDWYKPEAF